MIGLWSYNSVNLPSTRLPREDEWPIEATRRTHFGQHVLWREYDKGSDGGRHLSADTLEPYRQEGDAAFDNLLELYAKEGRPLQAGDDLFTGIFTTETNGATRNGSISPTTSKADILLQQTLAKYSQVPNWVDPEQLARGQRVFLAYLPAIGLSLYYRSLVPGFSIPKIAAVLQATAYLAPPASKTAVQDRLMDTGAFLGACLQSDDVNDILPGGGGWKAALRVRLLHAKIRRQLLSRTKSRQWDTHHLGIPINQEDMAATLLAFSTNALLGCEMVLGRPLPRQDRSDYLALWRYLGWLLGVSVDEENSESNNLGTSDSTTRKQQLRALDPCGPGWYPSQANPLEHSYAIFQSVIFHSLHPDASSVTIAHHLLKQGRRQDGDSDNNTSTSKKSKAQLEQSDQSWFHFRGYQCRRFVGDALADALQLPIPSTRFGKFKMWCLSQVYLSMVTIYTVASLPWSPFRNRLIAFHRTHMTTFMETWNVSHLERMRKRLQSSTSTTSSSNTSSVCPFAMIIQEDSQ